MTDALTQLIDGYRRFRNGYYRENQARLTDLAEGQAPKVAVVGCCDSRVDPMLITDSEPGDLFVIRNVANLVPPCEGEGVWHGTSAALQFAVTGLEVEHIIVLGHARCGGIRALMEQKQSDSGDFIGDWMSIARDARDKALARDDLRSMDEKSRACELNAIQTSLANLETFPWVRERLSSGSLQLHGWYYDMVSGDLLKLDGERGEFISLY